MSLLAFLQANSGLLILLLVILLFIVVAWQVVTFSELRRLKALYARLTRGARGENLEQMLLGHIEEVRAAKGRMEELERTLQTLQRACEYDLQHLGIVRFNPFANTGGDQSFALALADAHGDGAIITSLHGREGTRVYARALHGWEAANLSDEEREAIAQARARRRGRLS